MEAVAYISITTAGNTKYELEKNAFERARTFFGDDVPLKVYKDYEVVTTRGNTMFIGMDAAWGARIYISSVAKEDEPPSPKCTITAIGADAPAIEVDALKQARIIFPEAADLKIVPDYTIYWDFKGYSAVVTVQSIDTVQEADSQ